MYSVILHYSKCYCVLLLTDVCFLFFLLFIETQHDSVCNYYVVQFANQCCFCFFSESTVYSVILHYSKCYCVLLLTDVFLFFSSLH